MAGRRGQYRTWEELTGSERRRGLVVLGGAGVVVIGAVLWVFGGTSTAAAVGAPAPVMAARGTPPSPAATPTATAADSSTATAADSPPAAEPPTATAAELTAFYAATSEYRWGIALAESDVRTAIARNTGRALKPACVSLASRAATASTAALTIPAGDVGAAWTEGLRSFTQASRWCGQLFDGTKIQVSVLLTDTSTALDAADTAWSRLKPTAS